MNPNKKMKLRRISRDLSQDKLAMIAGVSRNTIAKIEQGNIEGVSLGNLKKVAKALDSSVEVLFLKRKKGGKEDGDR